jgi:carboxylesterase type B
MHLDQCISFSVFRLHHHPRDSHHQKLQKRSISPSMLPSLNQHASSNSDVQKSIHMHDWKLMAVDPLSSSQFTQAVFNNPPPEESEDCLYLNVYAPATPAGGNGRAVMFWIYGGSLQFGNAGQDTYDGSIFAAYEDVIVVTTNYRTNGILTYSS